jgi:signal peptidase I
MENSRKISIDKDTMYQEISRFIAEGKTVSITVKGYSMNPFLMHLRDQITLGPWKDEDIRKGTVALVRDVRGNVLIHRIIRREGDTIILEGDGNIGLQEKATLESIAGIMHSITRKNRTYSSKSFIWKAYSWIWMVLRPVRLYPLVLWRKLNPQQPLR